MRENLTARIIEAGGRLTVKSALNPILWLCAMITAPALVVAPFFSATPTWLITLAWGAGDIPRRSTWHAALTTFLGAVATRGNSAPIPTARLWLQHETEKPGKAVA